MLALKQFLWTLFLVFAWDSMAFAAGGNTESVGTTLFRVLTFALFLGIIWKFAGDKIKAFLGGRRQTIAKELEDLAQRKEEAKARLLEVEKNIADIAAEREAILAEYHEQGEALKAAIIEKAEQAAKRITEQAEMGVANERNMAIAAIREEVAEMVVEAAEKALKQKLTNKEHDKLIKDSLTKVVLN